MSKFDINVGDKWVNKRMSWSYLQVTDVDGHWITATDERGFEHRIESWGVLEQYKLEVNA